MSAINMTKISLLFLGSENTSSRSDLLYLNNLRFGLVVTVVKQHSILSFLLRSLLVVERWLHRIDIDFLILLFGYFKCICIFGSKFDFFD